MTKKDDGGTRDPKTIVVEKTPEMSQERAIAGAAIKPALNAALVIEAFQGNLLGDDVSLADLVSSLRESMKDVGNDDMQVMEAMLVGQATALQTVFTSLSRKATLQTGLKQYEVMLNLALKAQNQSRTTIQTLIELKFPRHATFVRQANIAHGPQQVNNGAQPQPAGDDLPGRPQDASIAPNKLLKDSADEIVRMDIGTTKAPGRGDSQLAPVGSLHRAEVKRGKAQGGGQCLQRRSAADASNAERDPARAEPVAQG